MKHQSSASASSLPPGFTLVELLVVIGIISLFLIAVVPAVTMLKGSGDITAAAYTISDALQQARTYAMANNTYVWVGFYEESAAQPSSNPANPGVGRVVLSTVASKDGTIVYDPNAPTEIDPSRISQVGKLSKVEGIHLATFVDGSGTGDSFDTRPAVNDAKARIGDTTPPDWSVTPFRYPLGSSSSTPQYTFTKAVEFSPRGEVRIDNSNYSYKPIAEIGICPTHGNQVDVKSKNLVAVQFGGIGGNFAIYRR